MNQINFSLLKHRFYRNIILIKVTVLKLKSMKLQSITDSKNTSEILKNKVNQLQPFKLLQS